MGRMNAKMIIDNAILLKDDEIESTYGILWINDAISVLCEKYNTACQRKVLDVVIDKDITQYEVPEDYQVFINVAWIEKKEGDKYFRYYDWNVKDYNRIDIAEKGEYKIYFNTVPENVLELKEIPTIHPLYHTSLSRYVASKELERIDKTDPKAVNLFEEFLNRADSVNSRLSTKKKGRQTYHNPNAMLML